MMMMMMMMMMMVMVMMMMMMMVMMLVPLCFRREVPIEMFSELAKRSVSRSEYRPLHLHIYI